MNLLPKKCIILPQMLIEGIMMIKEKEYLQIRAIRLDTKSLMYNHSIATVETLSSLAELIQETTK